MPRVPRTNAWSTLNQLAQRLNDALQTLISLRPPLRLRPVPVRVQPTERREPPGL